LAVERLTAAEAQLAEAAALATLLRANGSLVAARPRLLHPDQLLPVLLLLQLLDLVEIVPIDMYPWHCCSFPPKRRKRRADAPRLVLFQVIADGGLLDGMYR